MRQNAANVHTSVIPEELTGERVMSAGFGKSPGFAPLEATGTVICDGAGAPLGAHRGSVRGRWGESQRMAPSAESGDVPVLTSFAALGDWLDRLPAAAYVDGVRLWSAAELRESLLDLRLHPELPEVWERLPEAGGLRGAVQALLDDRDQRLVVLQPGNPLNWLTVSDGLVVQLGRDKAILIREAGVVVLRFFGGERFPLRLGVNSLGRGSSADLNLAAHPSVSREHALIEVLEGDGVVVADRGSRFGTAVEVAPKRLIAALIGDLRWRPKAVVTGLPDRNGYQPVYSVDAMIAEIEAAAQMRVSLTFEDDDCVRPTEASCQAVARAVRRVTRSDGLRAVVTALLLAPSVHRPDMPWIAELWPEGYCGVRWSDGLFLDIFGAVQRDALLRQPLLGAFSRQAEGVWKVRFPVERSADGVGVTAAEVAAWREQQVGRAATLADGDVVARLAYEKRTEEGSTASRAERARAVLECLVAPTTTVTPIPVEHPACLEVLRRAESGRLTLAVASGPGDGQEVCAVGRVGAEVRWVELITPRGTRPRQQIAFPEFQRRFELVLTAVAPTGRLH